MKAVFKGIFILAILLPAGQVNAQETLLRYDLKQGETFVLDVEIQQRTSSESVETEEISLSSHSLLEFRVDSVVPGEAYHMSVRYRDLRLSMIAPGLDIAFNSEDLSNPTLTAMLDSLESGSFQITIDRRGELTSVGGLDPAFISRSSTPEEAFSEQQVVLQTLEEVYGPDSFRSLAGLFLTVYPVLPSMTNWTNDMIYFFNTRPVQMAGSYNLARSTESYHVIQGLGMLNSSSGFEEETGLGRVESTVSGSQTFDFQMDRNTGWLNRCVSRQRVLIQTTILSSPSLPEGLKIPSYTETFFEVTGYRGKE
jgi:hypothetical protein